jgi:hypothetical protein
MQVTPIKLSKFVSSSKILNANHMLISYFLHITILYFHLLFASLCSIFILIQNMTACSKTLNREYAY